MIHKTNGGERICLCGKIMVKEYTSCSWTDKTGKIKIDCPECLRLMPEKTRKCLERKGK